MKIDKEIELDDIIYLYKKNIKVILCTILLFTLMGIVYSYVMIKPKFKSTATILTRRIYKLGNSEVDEKINEIPNVNIEVFKHIILSDSLINNAISKSKLDEDASSIKANMEVSTEKDTGAIYIELSNSDSKVIPILINKIIDEFKIEVGKNYELYDVSVIEQPIENSTPYNVNYKKNIIKFVIGGLGLVCLIIFIKYYLNDKVNSVKQIEKILGKNRLTVIPEINKKG